MIQINFIPPYGVFLHMTCNREHLYAEVSPYALYLLLTYSHNLGSKQMINQFIPGIGVHFIRWISSCSFHIRISADSIKMTFRLMLLFFISYLAIGLDTRSSGFPQICNLTVIKIKTGLKNKIYD